MSRFAVGNLFLFASMACAAGAQLLLKGLMNDVEPAAGNWTALRELMTAERLMRGGGALSLIGIGFICWLLSLARLELSYAYPIACSSVLLVALLSVTVLGEPMTFRMWLGTLLVLGGIALLVPRA